MFSGIIDKIGRIHEARAMAGGMVLVIEAPGYWGGVANGASIAIDGVCLTVTAIEGDYASFDVIAETLRCTTLSGLSQSSRVNLQKSLRVGDFVDGHFVQGHVDAVAAVSRVEQTPQEAMWWFKPPREIFDYIIPKGGIAIDGISLTIAKVEGDEFSVALIPTTLNCTTIGQKKMGDRVNLETDILARTVVRYLRKING